MLKNTRKGAYAEYFAIYIFSVLGFTTPVPRQEDYGVDLFCSLNHNKKNQTFVGDAYAVQVKSSYSDITYGITHKGRASKEQIDFLFNLEIPFFISIVDLNNQTISLYSTSPYRFVKKEHPDCSAIRFKFEQSIGNSTIHTDYTRRKIRNPTNIKGDGYKYTVNLQHPIVSIQAEDIQDVNQVYHFREILRTYVRLEQKNIVFDDLHWPHFHWPHKFTTNDKNVTFKWIHYDDEPDISNPDRILEQNGQLIIALALSFKLHGRTKEYEAIKTITRALPDFHKDAPTKDFEDLFT